jgi:predicted RNase H-like HicB family nuclease
VRNLLILKVYIEGFDGQWEALCLDFDIAVQGTTIDAAIASMKEAIAIYLQRVQELPERERAAFLRRRVPWHVQFGFFVHALMIGARAHSGTNGKTRGEVPIPCSP